jgi:hypothetical protein
MANAQQFKITIFALALMGLGMALFAVIYARDTEARSFIHRGDFAGFYGAAVLAERGELESLYSDRLQRDVQNEFWPSLKGRYLYFAYPPYVALILSPLAKLGPLQAKFVFTGLMFVALLISIALASQFAPIFKKNYLATAAFFVLFLPVSYGTVGGQNIALSMLLYSAAILSLHRGGKWAEVICGLCLGLWIFKPHFGVMLIFLFLCARAWRVVATACFVALLYYLLGAFTFGFTWPLEWIPVAKEFAVRDIAVNQEKFVSLAGVVQAFATWWGANELWTKVATGIASVVSILLFLWTAFQFSKASKIGGVEEKRIALQELLILAGPVIVLASPHTMYYDVGICVIACARFLELQTLRSFAIGLFALALIFVVTMFKGYLPFQPLFFVVLWVFLSVGSRFRRLHVIE